MNSQAPSNEWSIPTFGDIVSKENRGEALTALDQFVYDNEPADEAGEHCFRDGLAKLLAATSPPADRIPLPQNEAQAELMAKAGMMWLEQNAPHRLKQPSHEPRADAYQQLAEFFSKYGIGPKTPPSCFVCGQQMNGIDDVGVAHLELLAVKCCKRCKDAADRASQPPAVSLDCTEGCSDDHKHRWEIEPHPYNSSDFDTYVTDDDADAMRAAKDAAEVVCDDMDEGETRTISIRFNGDSALTKGGNTP